MDYLELLRQIVCGDKISALAPSSFAFPQDQLRFVLETDHESTELRKAINALLGSAFVLRPLFKPKARCQFYVLAFPGVERTIAERELFSIAYALTDELGLISVEPDIGTSFFAEHDGETVWEEGGSVLTNLRLCAVAGSAPPNRLWAHLSARVPDAWALSKGKGVLVGQPDTGMVNHDQIRPGSLQMKAAMDFIGGEDRPKDVLVGRAGNPGHGTAVGSVIIGIENEAMSGVAPDAELVPIRCTDNVTVLNQVPLAAAIAHATDVGCDIISLSLGGLPSRALHASIQHAVASDVIVVSAAGSLSTVVWPARYNEVIAVAATNILDVPWHFSSHGGAVDIAAPGELVWRASLEPADGKTSRVEPGQGTSYAVAIVAGVAALWLSHHGKPAVKAEAKARGVTVQALFKIALQGSARRPQQWDSRIFGPGIIDATRLVSTGLADIPQVGTVKAVAEGPDVPTWLCEELGAGVMDGTFAWKRFSQEIAHIMLVQSKRGGALSELSTSAKIEGTRPSALLSSAALLSKNHILTRFGETRGSTSVSRPFFTATPQLDLPKLRKAIAIKGTGLESALNPDAHVINSYLSGRGRQDQLGRLQRILDSSSSNDNAFKTTIHDHVSVALKEIIAGETMSRVGRVGLEALIMLTGRPALRTTDGNVDLDDPRASEWSGALALAMQHGRLRERIGKVGRIDQDGVHLGTGFVCGEGLVMTNRHVVQGLAAPRPSRNNQEGWILNSPDVTVDFADAPDPAITTNRFVITEVVGAGPREIDPDRLDFSYLDVAILRVETRNAAGTSLPLPMDLVANAAKAGLKKSFFAIGYPAKPSQLPHNDKNEYDTAVLDRLLELFDEYSVKYVSPGEIIGVATGELGVPQFWTLQHDATTLEGSSGSCLLFPDNPMGAVGLHFGGTWQKRNYAHSMSVVHAQSTFLSQLPLKWI